MFFLSIWLCFKREKILNLEVKEKFESKFNVLFAELKEGNFPLFYFWFFFKRVCLMVIVNWVSIPILRLTISFILSLAVIFIKGFIYLMLNFSFKDKIKNFSNIANELILIAVHLMVFLNSLKQMKGYFEEIKNGLLILLAICWATNSMITIFAFVLGIAGYVKSKLDKNRILPEGKNEKDRVVTNLET